MKNAAFISIGFLVLAILGGCPFVSTDGTPGEELPEPAVYAGGSCAASGGVEAAGYWVNSVWTPVTPPGLHGSSITALVVKGDTVYAGGWSWTSTSSSSQIAGYWKDGTWNGPTSGSYATWVTSLAVDGSDVYAGGHFYSSRFSPGYYKNSIWKSLPALDPSLNSKVLAAAAVGSQIYMVGYSTDSIGSPTAIWRTYPGYWLNESWVTLQNYELGGVASAVQLIGTEMYAAGVCGMSTDDGPQPLRAAGYWKNGSWIPLMEPASLSANAVTGMAVSDEGVVVLGHNGSEPGYWTISGWVGLPTEGEKKNSVASSITVVGTDVYVGGTSVDAGVALPGYWKNGNWNSLPLPSGATGGRVNSIAIVP